MTLLKLNHSLAGFARIQKLTAKQRKLKLKIMTVLKGQGFKINPHLRPSQQTKRAYKRIQQKSRLEQISLNKKFLENFQPKAKEYCKDGSEIIPEEISLELRGIEADTFLGDLFRWWNFMWWSMPYQRSYGRQMRFMLWDKTHDLPFGLISLQSPVLRMAVRDKTLGIPREKLDYWVNMSMNAQRVGALPPYNELLGGKMVALTLSSNEIRHAYKRKYENIVTIMEKRKLNANLLFITTTSAFGKSSLYDRLKYNDEVIAQSLGYTRGAGTFHIPEYLYREILAFLEGEGIDTRTTYGYGPSRKIKLLDTAFKMLGISEFHYHGIKREYFLFSHVKNLREVITLGQKPIWFDRPFDDLIEFWKQRWAIPRSQNTNKWREFSTKEFFRRTELMLRRS